MIRFRVATYNVHKCKGIDWRTDPRRIAEVIREFDPDVLALQEVFDFQNEAIAQQTGLQFVFGAARNHSGQPYGNAVLTRLPVVESETYDVTTRAREPRKALRAALTLTSSAVLHFFCVHLGTSYFERREQARLLLSDDILGQPSWRGSRIVAGDFNEWTRGLATRMLSGHLQSADIAMHLRRRKTYPGLLPLLHLDHIYYDEKFQLRGMHLHRTRKALLASDHLPLVADFQNE